MLVISRKSQEYLQIGDNIIVKVIRTASGSVKIGIDAPGGVRVLRGELSALELDPTAEAPRPRRELPREHRESEVRAAVEAI
ncbi:carbon storage regulator [Planctomicrobium sp. SH664]|uniref:carbon storage regulator n=1 Tax=Planctomicrobium sp. SH664 TaxID=3448125 RepID=UPI003F5CB0CC